MTGFQKSRSQDSKLDLGRTGFQVRDRFVILTNAIATAFAAASLSLCLIAVITALSIKVVAATPIAG